MTEWYSKLREYFPEREMKSEAQMKILFSDKETYKRETGPEHVLIYLEKEDFIFVDYILISGKYRGNGMGSTLISRLKKKNKPILLEVEPITPSDPDSKKRVQFYERNSFKKANSIIYQRRHVITDELNDMDIFYWSPERKNEEWVFSKMREVYTEVHSYKAADVYDKEMQKVTEVLSIKEDNWSVAK
ncbi:GNAT superfamily N-acetyltransferase [Peribacillus deserti]|uniref:GNAT superfamily N-acetyltransferase n=1 Tax=Peribacillus deserti TaxID=673318 RepID=A0ABS2QM54_9BACI|nr:GNAT family N-acetyltransferase [Peribacillus deserti]MBM7694254.1 GNAT superfamily N-acetyltransferase [Peribacillus deserti]